MGMELFNTETRSKEEFEPADEQVRFYSCGQTIYDDLHVGNARAYVFWDTLTRYMRNVKGWNVRHVQNITDVGHLTDDGDQGEDKVEKRAEELGVEPMELVEQQIDRYFDDMEALNIRRQDIVPRATGHINEMENYVQDVIDNGYAYEREGNVYFDLDAFLQNHEYGEMAGRDVEELKEEAESRVEPDGRKKNQYDFALWLNADESHLMKWEVSFEVEGETIDVEGYPGWHLECSVMSNEYLGDSFDIHAGGKDHIFPHHPNEQAQCLAANGETQADLWLHNEFLTTADGTKMSKSKGNFVYVQDLVEDGFSGDVIRLYLVSSHYRSETSFSREQLKKTQKELRRIRKNVQRIRLADGEEQIFELRSRFEEAMDDDLNTAEAKQTLMEAIRKVNRVIEDGRSPAGSVADELVELFSVLGVDAEPDPRSDREMAELLLELRSEYRNKERYEKADRIRDVLESSGYEIEDADSGTRLLSVK
jgi:cysteinyl-tRNA synthetase